MPAQNKNIAHRVFSVVMLATLVGCGAPAPEAPKAPDAEPKTTSAVSTPAPAVAAAPAEVISAEVKKSPTLTLKTAYLAANKGDFALADKFLSEKTCKIMNDAPEGAETDGTKAYWKAMTRNGELQSVEIAHEEMQDGQAVILVELNFKEGQLFTQEVLIQEGGMWKINPTIEERTVQQAQKD